MSRYTSAYCTARVLKAVGDKVKLIACVLGGCIALIGLMMYSESVVYAVGGVTSGAIVAIPMYVLGILISVQGQILQAILDTAVNTSSLLTKDEVQEIMLSSSKGRVILKD